MTQTDLSNKPIIIAGHQVIPKGHENDPPPKFVMPDREKIEIIDTTSLDNEETCRLCFEEVRKILK